MMKTDIVKAIAEYFSGELSKANLVDYAKKEILDQLNDFSVFILTNMALYPYLCELSVDISSCESASDDRISQIKDSILNNEFADYSLYMKIPNGFYINKADVDNIIDRYVMYFEISEQDRNILANYVECNIAVTIIDLIRIECSKLILHNMDSESEFVEENSIYITDKGIKKTEVRVMINSLYDILYKERVFRVSISSIDGNLCLYIV